MSAATASAMTEQSELPTSSAGGRAPGWWGMLFFCITEGSLFLYLLGSYFYLRGSVVAFAAEGGQRPDLKLPLLLTLLLVSSSVTMRWGEVGIKRGDTKRLMIGLAATIALGLAFLGTQLLEYARLEHMPQTDAYWSAFYTITGLHGAHVMLGVMMLSTNLVRASLGHFTGTRHLAVQNGALYWHTVDIVWIAVLGTLYISPYL